MSAFKLPVYRRSSLLLWVYCVDSLGLGSDHSWGLANENGIAQHMSTAILHTTMYNEDLELEDDDPLASDDDTLPDIGSDIPSEAAHKLKILCVTGVATAEYLSLLFLLACS